MLAADDVVHEVQAPGGAAYGPIVERFGPGVVAADGTLDRAALAARVFADPVARADLERLVHPLVRAALAARARQPVAAGRVVVLDIPLLVETGGRAAYPVDAVLVVDCPVETAVARLVADRRMDEADARRRVAAQATREQRLAAADLVIDNAGSPADLAREVDRAWEELTSSNWRQ